ncbi:glycoside hydrolase family 15 [Cellulomonas fengjieae]|uniref:Glycoside hydrolase family 15 n=1 Tax=Cellulomonas fengjieae TaxID=2819978 RepID=A0ABS3SGW6_9CELL|nr:glycoside hydrolase family 15 [Cellulomonas fengjieae]MBO3084983.1 glycoside hydrolase family 15 [Cellulomonas fengjieae]MBO3100730.1 glycoside hydrolase family 15 [Cellulomonas fengjieae]QVI66419.1 glycoside hydrolase family 15 [Cellulomonas fengjieae]
MGAVTAARRARGTVVPVRRARHLHRSRRAGGLVGTALVVAATTALVATVPTGALATAPPATAAVFGPPNPAYATIPLYLEGLTTFPGGLRVPLAVGTDATFLPGTHVVDPAARTLQQVVAGAPWTGHGATASAAATVAQRQRAWLASGTVPGLGGPYEDMARAALLDLHTLQLPDGAAVAAWSQKWRYVWPRDASFVAVALARTGHVPDALEILGFLERVQSPDGSFQARYLPDGSGPPDERGIQTDGTGWALWSAGLVLAEIADPGERAAAATRLRPLLQRSTRHAMDLVAHDGLPPASPDYWEVPEDSLTLGTVAPLVAGLQQASELLVLTGDDALARDARDASVRTQAAVVRAFGGTGFARYAVGGHADAASAFLLPPFVTTAVPGVEEAWRASATTMLRPANGLAPGAGWRQDGVSWTPQTSLYAWVAAENGDRERAEGWLTFLDEHRTPSGSLPEKVLADGSPAAVAPLGWSAACVLLALDALESRPDAAG